MDQKVCDIVEYIRASYFTPERIQVRKESEDNASTILQSHLGNMTLDDLAKVIDLLNSDYYDDKKHLDRFGLGLRGYNRTLILGNDVQRFNELIVEVYEKENLENVDELIRSLKGIKDCFISGLLYLKNRDKYNMFMPKTASGIEAAYPEETPLTAGTFKERYTHFNRLAQKLKEECDIEPQELDVVLVNLRREMEEWDKSNGSGERMESETYNRIKELLQAKKQVILYGPPGTGKTYKAQKFAVKFLLGSSGEEEKNNSTKDALAQLHDEGRIEFITFHPSYGYEEFVEGITVNTEAESEEIRYIRKWGIFKKICTEALAKAINEELNASKEPWEDQWAYIYEKYRNKIKDKPREKIRNEIWNVANKFVLIIDEINRGDISKIFGELVTLIENDTRLAQENEIVVQLPYSNDEFGVPPNLHIVGTMNTADRSIALVDIALRRRFGFVEMKPDFDTLMAEHIEKDKEELQKNNVYQHLINSVEAVKKINANIIRDLGRDKQIGHSFFFKVKDQVDLMMVWQYEILPLLEEYYYCNYDKILATLGMKSDNPYVNMNDGIRGFQKIEDLVDFLNLILNLTGTENE